LGLETGGVPVEPEVEDHFNPRRTATRPPVRWYRARQPEPRCRPWRAPLRTNVKPIEYVGRDSCSDGQRNPVGVNKREDALPQLTVDSSFGELAIVVHSPTVMDRRRA
ncbi:MAG: hypothetical protein ACI8V4_003775, partial [Ilumatobacter sp.]